MKGERNKIAFLFGAGISKISTKTITAAIGRDEINIDQPDYKKKKEQAVTSFIKLLKIKIEEYYFEKFKKVRYEASYEDIYSLIKEIEDHIDGFYGFVPIEIFLKEIYPEVFLILRQSGGHENKTSMAPISDLSKLCDMAMIRIECIVGKLLSDLSDYPFDNLCFLKTAVEKYSPDNIDIFTLNHDLLLETYLQKENVAFINGIDVNGKWNNKLFDSSDGKVRLYKLHGSIEWKNTFLHTPMKQENICVSTNGKITSGDEDRSVILIGTKNKILDYYKWNIFTELHQRFKESLYRTKKLIISGYSFGDDGINVRIVDWLVGDSKERNAIIIDPNPDDLFYKRPNELQNALSRGQIKIFKNKIEEIKWNEIEKDLKVQIDRS